MSYTVYMHINKADGRKYIGTTSLKPRRRWNNGNGYKGQPFYDEILRVGWDNFEHTIVRSGMSKEDALSLEHELVDKYRATDSKYGYNVVRGGHGKGIMDIGTKMKISSSMKKCYRENRRDKPMEGKHHTDETKRKIAFKNYKNGKYSLYV